MRPDGGGGKSRSRAGPEPERGLLMKILITGARGFVGKNLVCELKNRGYRELFLYDVDSDPSLLEQACRECGFVFHLAGINRPKDEADFMKGNFGFTDSLLGTLKKYRSRAGILISSSIQAALDNPYGRSKKAGEDLLRAYGEETGAPVFIYRLPNVFGKWCRPNYNSVVATFCNNVAHDLPITVNDPATELSLVYIDDVVSEFIGAMEGRAHCENGICSVPVTHRIRLGELAELIRSFRAGRGELSVPDQSDPLTKKLYAAYLSYLPEDGYSYPLEMHCDARGSFTEFLRTPDRGQVSVNISHPGIVKGNHWHHTKNEKFLVVSGRGVIRFRRVGDDRVTNYFVSGEKLEVVDIPTGCTHCIENLGDTDMVTVMWCSECFDPAHPDTFALPVQEQK